LPAQAPAGLRFFQKLLRTAIAAARERYGLYEAAIEKICRLADQYERIRIWRFD